MKEIETESTEHTFRVLVEWVHWADENDTTGTPGFSEVEVDAPTETEATLIAAQMVASRPSVMPTRTHTPEPMPDKAVKLSPAVERQISALRQWQQWQRQDAHQRWARARRLLVWDDEFDGDPMAEDRNVWDR